MIGLFASTAAYLEQLSSPANRAYRGAIAPMLGSPHEDRLHRVLGTARLPGVAPIGAYVVLTQSEARPERRARRRAPRGARSRTGAAAGHLGQCHLERRGRSEHAEVLSVRSDEEAFGDYLDSEARRAVSNSPDELVAPVDDRRHHLLHGPRCLGR